MQRMTAAKAKHLKTPGRYFADDTLYLVVTERAGRIRKSWVQRLTINGRRTDLGLGSYQFVSLAEARDLAYENRKAARRGLDPIAKKREAKVPTFRDAAKKTFETKQARWRNARTAGIWDLTMERYAFPVIGDLHVNRIERKHVLQVLTPIWSTKAETARRVRRNIKAVLAWCTANGYLDVNIVDLIDAALPAQPSTKQNMRALPYQELPAALEIIRNSKASIAAKACLEFTILTACRSGESRGAIWDEIDLDAKTWTIPAARMKTNKEHKQPLSTQAIAVLKGVMELRERSGLVFPSPVRTGRPLSDMSLTKVLRDNGLAARATVHGMRTCFRTWASEKTDSDHAVMELCLAHAVGSAVERAYARSSLIAKRGRLLQRWGDFVTDRQDDKVVQLHG